MMPYRTLKPFVPDTNIRLPFPSYSNFELDEILHVLYPALEELEGRHANPLAVLHYLRYIEEVLRKITEKQIDPDTWHRFLEHIELDCKEAAGSYIGT